MQAVHIGISDESRQEVADEMGRLLADTYGLYLKTHGYHWNVTGPMFQTLHVLFETQYNELWLAIDDVAERIRSLGHVVPVGYDEFSALTSVEPGRATKAMDMVADLTAGHETVARTIRSIWPKAEACADQATLDILTQRLSVHEKTAWMLRSMLD